MIKKAVVFMLDDEMVTQAIAGLLVAESSEFHVEPFPDGVFEVTVKPERRPVVEKYLRTVRDEVNVRVVEKIL